MKLRKTIMIDEEVYKRVSAFADENGISVSGAISVLVGQALQAQKGMDSLQHVAKLFSEMQKTVSEKDMLAE